MSQPLPLTLHHLQGVLKQYGSCRPTVYFLIDGDYVVYVGSTRSLDARISAHRKDPSKVFNRVYFLEVENEGKMEELECSLIHCLKPKFNRARMGRPIKQSIKVICARLGVNLVGEKTVAKTLRVNS